MPKGKFPQIMSENQQIKEKWPGWAIVIRENLGIV